MPLLQGFFIIFPFASRTTSSVLSKDVLSKDAFAGL